jgi:hypothetical protein
MLLSGAEVEPKTAKPARDPLLGGGGQETGSVARKMTTVWWRRRATVGGERLRSRDEGSGGAGGAQASHRSRAHGAH